MEEPRVTRAVWGATSTRPVFLTGGATQPGLPPWALPLLSTPLASPTPVNPSSLPPTLQGARAHWAFLTLVTTPFTEPSIATGACPPLCERVTTGLQ